MKNQCDVCNRTIEKHLSEQSKRLCFSCLTEEVSESGSIAVFNLKNKPVQAPCAICDLQSSGSDLAPSPWGFICRNCAAICQTQAGISFETLRPLASKEWLLKTNAKILGPMTTEEVEEGLRENRFVAHDEITKPAGRWHLLRDEEQFRLVVNEVRNRRASRKDQDQTASGTGSNTGTMTPAMEELIRERSFQTDKLIEDLVTRPAVEKIAPPAEPGTRDLMKNQVVRQAPKVQADVISLKNKRLWGALALLLFAGVFVFFRLIQPRTGDANQRNRAFQELMDSGLRAEKVGNYQKARDAYTEAGMFRPSDPELLLHLAPLVLNYDRQMIQAQRMFEEILRTEKEPNYQRVALTGLGLISLEAHELGKARDFFTKAQTIDNSFVPAKVNLGIVSFFEDNYAEARRLLEGALNNGQPDGAVNISYAEVLIAIAEKNSEPSLLNTAHNVLEAYLNLIHDYEQETLIQDARVLALQQRYSEAAKRIERLLDVDPEQTELHLHDWAIYRGRASWGLLLDSLKKTASDLSSSPRLSAALGLALYRGREKLEGAQNIRTALQQSPQDPLLLALAGWVETKLGQTESGAVYIKQAAATSDKYRLPHILAARLCQSRSDWDCAKGEWNKVLALDGRSAEALHGLAYVAWHQNKDRVQALALLTQLYANDPYYIPYLELQQEISNSNAKSEVQ